MIQKETSPYDSPKPLSVVARQRPRWVRKFVVLNAVLLLLPPLVALGGYIELQIEMALNRDVVYELVGYSVSETSILWPMLYLLIPNLVLFCWLGFSSAKNTKRSPK